MRIIKIVKDGFLKSVQTLSVMFEDRLTGLGTSSKSFGDYFCFRRKMSKKSSFFSLLEGLKMMKSGHRLK